MIETPTLIVLLLIIGLVIGALAFFIVKLLFQIFTRSSYDITDVFGDIPRPPEWGDQEVVDSLAYERQQQDLEELLTFYNTVDQILTSEALCDRETMLIKINAALTNTKRRLKQNGEKND